MSWFRIDDHAAFGAKVVAAGNEAFGAWARAGAWSSGELTDGFVPEHVALTIAPKRIWDRLRDAKAGHDHGLVEEREGGWQIHNFTKRNPTAATVKAERDATKRRVEEWRGKRKSNGVTSPVTNGVTNGVVTPDETPPPSRSHPMIPLNPPAGGMGRKGKRVGGQDADGRYREAWLAGVLDAAPGAKFTPPTRMGLKFAEALNAHAEGLRGDELLAWIRAKAAEWIRSTRYLRVITPGAFVQWLDGQSVEASRSHPEAEDEPISPARRPFPASFDAIGNGGHA
ncbi:MAG TPA: hypothetical protein VLT47_11245 [Anaeromyxobacteraceae bacterium]|nr:hypothetical protein [Anaeromyxobacteraceae bacterium]